MPTVLQMEATECGAASLAMVLAYYGRWVGLEELRTATGVSRDGTKASNLLKAARHYGMAAKAFKKQPDGLLELPVPSIIHWNFNHFVVFEGIKGRRVHLNDPAQGPRVVDRDTLEEAFTGVVLAMEPGDGFARGGTAPATVRPLIRELARAPGALALVAGFGLVLVVPGVVVPGLSKQFVDQVLVRGTQDWLTPLLLGLACAALLRGVATFLQNRYLLWLEMRLAVTLAGRYFGRLLEHPIRFFTQRHPGDLADRVAGADRVAELLSGPVARNIVNLVQIGFFLGAAATFDPLLALLGLGLSAVNGIALWAVGRLRDEASRRTLADHARVTAGTVGIIRAFETIKAAGAEDDAFADWAGHHANLLAARQTAGLVNIVVSAVPMLVNGLTPIVVIGVGGFRVMDGVLSIGSLVAVQSLLQNVQSPLRGLVEMGGRLQSIRADLLRLSDVLGEEGASPRPGENDDEREAHASPRPDGHVELRGVSFGYNPLDPPLVEDLSLSVPPGCRVALVGASGSGKTTVGRLVAGLETPWAGTIRIDGLEIREIPSARFAEAVAYVDQDIMLFEGTIRENLTLWDPTVSDRALTQALKDTCLHADIAERDGQYDAPVAEGGANFSGGQRQRLELARALVNDPAVLVLDEATSALDPAIERRIDDNLRRRGCTCLIIAHRLSTVRDADEIVVLDKGRVVERGPHEHLLQAKGIYAGLIEGE